MATLKIWIMILLLVSGCVASVATEYGVTKKVDHFNDNRVTARMTGGVIDADYLGMVANPAQFNPIALRSNDNRLLATWISFSMEVVGSRTWLNIREGSTATFLLNGSEKIVLNAAFGNMDYSVSAPQRTVYTTTYDSGVFPITPDQLKRISYANSLEVRVFGASSFVDFPRKPNNSITPNFLINLRKFYETEISPYLK